VELKGAAPVLPVKDVPAAVAFYKDELGFAQAFDMGNYAGIVRGPIEFHLDGSGWGGGPVSARINLAGVDDIHAEVAPKGIVMTDQPLETKPRGVRQFSVLDPAGNRITFAQPAQR
jgi:catechol 2,3-dioxygenase-like lactoylglutathione lyase family enzyme